MYQIRLSPRSSSTLIRPLVKHCWRNRNNHVRHDSCFLSPLSNRCHLNSLMSSRVGNWDVGVRLSPPIPESCNAIWLHRDTEVLGYRSDRWYFNLSSGHIAREYQFSKSYHILRIKIILLLYYCCASQCLFRISLSRVHRATCKFKIISNISPNILVKANANSFQIAEAPLLLNFWIAKEMALLISPSMQLSVRRNKLTACQSWMSMLFDWILVMKLPWRSTVCLITVRFFFFSFVWKFPETTY